ncbi:MAG: Rne/Rng family ribonuclease, partial [Rhodothermia bacterium]|nr:Rne/Rng family ribonuclease [Rhodothermia bacterium]
SYLKPGAPLVVKIVKEPISNKGSRVSTDISLAGRFLVLVPLADYVAVSRRIFSYKERRRLRILAKSLLPKGFGLIVRTVADGKNAKVLDTDLRLLVDKWRKIEKKLQENPKAPLVLHEDVSMVSSIIRDLFSEEYEKIIIDNQRLHRNVKSYVNAVAPHIVPRIKLHRSDKHVFAATGIDKSVAQAFESRVNLPSGGYLIIEHTEAMHVVDVNSGRAGKGLSQEENSLKVNIESARQIAKQLRLRDLGGIIVVDFIDLRDDRNRKKVYDELKKEFRKDRAVTKILPMSDFGVVQITRQRLRPSVTTQADAPQALVSSNGTEPEKEKAVQVEKEPPSQPREPISVAPEKLTDQIEKRIQRLKKDGRKGTLVLKVHPFTGAFLTRNVPSLVTRWSLKFRLRLRLETDEAIGPSHFKFFDAKTGKEIAPERDKQKQKQRGSSRRGSGQRGKQKQPSEKS